MEYEKQVWVDSETPVDAVHLNHMEDGIAASFRKSGHEANKGLGTDASGNVITTDLPPKLTITHTETSTKLTIITAAGAQTIEIPNDSTANAANGVTFNESTGVLQLTSDGTPISGASVTIKLTDSYSRAEIDALLKTINDTLAAHQTEIETLRQEMGNIEVEGKTYHATYGGITSESGEVTENVFTLWETDLDGTESIKSRFIIQGGGGGSSAITNLVVERITTSPLILTPSDKVQISFSYSSTDGDGEQIDGMYSLKLGNAIIASGPCVHGVNTIDITEYVTIGTQKVMLTVTDDGGSATVKNWTVQIVDVRVETTFSDRITYPANAEIKFPFTPYGAVEKTVHFILDGTELEPMKVTTSGILQSYTLPAQAHGAHLLECYVTAMINTVPIETEHIFKDIVWFDEASDVPVISCIYRNDHYGKVTAKQYNTTSLPFYVFDPTTAAPSIVKTVDGNVVATETITTTNQIWTYKTSEIGEHTLVISCRDTSVTIVMDIVELGINVAPVTANLAFDFDPTSLSNSSEDRLWRDPNTGVAMAVSDNFDWVNGGYRLDSDGAQYFCVKAGTRATIDYKLFENDASIAGALFKMIFRVTNVRKVNSTFLNCVAGETPVGLRMDAHAAYLMTSATGEDPLYMPYSENDVIEFEVNVDPLDQENEDAESVILSYEDGVGYRPLIYDAAHRLYQYAADAVPITIGSDDCDVHVYRMKAYTSALSDRDILTNFIADARDAETMLKRYERNQIYDENNALTPESVANACPHLKVLKIDCPYFTQDKNEMVKNTIVELIHKGGDPKLDNIRALNCYHSGQGTTSNEYGYAGRNLNVYMCFDGVYTHKRVTFDPDYITELIFGDGTTISDGTGKITLTRTSVPNALYNIKVNIASSENANNALLSRRYNRYLPYVPPSVKRDPHNKITMEFYNTVVFVRENSEDLSSHREFADTGWHFYAIGNLGDSKDTDQTRTNDPSDHSEFVVEIADNPLPNANFPSGVTDSNGKQVYPITETQWKTGNPAYDSLHNAWGDTFEFRYSHPDITDEEEAANIATFNRFYKWVITATDAEFIDHLHDWCVPGAFEYFYLFTERYTMTDNRAKNTFWHWGRYYISQAQATAMGAEKAAWFVIDDEAAAINGGYRMDAWDYDNDTSLGINNSGEMTMPAGKEDIDYRTDGDPNSGYMYNGAESGFFCRLRDLMYPQLQTMFNNCESAGAWSAEGLINEFDAWQEQFPEELWRLDIERKYIRTYKGGTKRFLETMLNGRKKYHRRQWERDQEGYMSAKYVSTKAKEDQIMFRCNTPQSAVITPNYDLTLIPYSDMYLCVLYGNSAAPIRIRAKAGQEYKIENPLVGTVFDDTAVLIYCASRIQAINDLSGAYIHDNDFSKAEKLQTLIIGNPTPGYANLFLTALNIGNNPLLETLDVRGCPNLTGSLNLTACGNLVTLNAHGTSLKGVTFAPSGAIQTAILPNTVNTLVMRNLHYLTGLQTGYDSLESLTEEYSVVDELAIVREAADTLQTVKLAGIDWVVNDTELLNAILAMDNATLIGKVHINGPVRQQEYYQWMQRWPDLQVSYESMVQQYPVTFLNWDGTVLYTEYVDRNGTVIDPVISGKIPTPTRANTVSTVYTYAGWDGSLSNVLEARTLTATYTESVQQYTVRWYGYQGQLMDEQIVSYGTDAVYAGEIPTRTDEEEMQVFHQFLDWDKSTGFVDQDINVHPRWESGDLPASGTDTETMNATQLYAIKRNKMAQDYFQHRDRVLITMGYQPEFNNIEHVDLADEMVFDGATYVDTGIKLLAGGINQAWTLVADMTYEKDTANATMVSCMQDDGFMGFNIKYVNGVSVQWGTNAASTASGNNREIVVLRHEAGSRNIKVYASKYDEMQIMRTEVNKLVDTSTDKTLILGAAKSDVNVIFNHATGVLHSCRIWYGDLGDTVCRKIASWPRETYRWEVGNFGSYMLANNSGQATQIDFICSTLLSRKRYMHPVGTVSCSFAESEMFTWLAERVVPAMPDVWQRVMEICSVRFMEYLDGTNFNIGSCTAKMWLPSYYEIGAAESYMEPWIYEGGQHIPYSISREFRVKFPGTIHFARDGCASFLQDTDPALDSNVGVQDGDLWFDTGNGHQGYVRMNGAWYASDDYWLRGAMITANGQYTYVSRTGYSTPSSGVGGAAKLFVCPRFSI